MVRELRDVPVPETEERFIPLIETTFEKLTGSPFPNRRVGISDSDSIFVKKYARRGMSGGHISLQFWLNSAMPLLPGTVISRSTSSAEWPGHWVISSTWGGASRAGEVHPSGKCHHVRT